MTTPQIAIAAARLPKHAQKIRTRLHAEDAERSARARARSAEIRKLSEEVARTEERVAQLDDLDRHGKLYRERSHDNGDGLVIERTRDTRALDEAAAVAENARAQLAQAVADKDEERCMTGAQVDRFIATIPSTAEIQVHSAKPTLTKGESRSDAIARLDSRIDELKAEHKSTTRAPRTTDEILADWSNTVRRLRAKGAPNVIGAMRGDEVQLPKVKLPGVYGNTFEWVPDGIALAAWLLPEELERRGAELIKINCESESALSADQKAKKLAEIDADLMKAHRERAALVEMIVASGRKASHRHDAPVPAVLGIAIGPETDPLAI